MITDSILSPRVPTAVALTAFTASIAAAATILVSVLGIALGGIPALTGLAMVAASGAVISAAFTACTTLAARRTS